MSRPIYSQFLCSKFVLYYYVIFSNLCYHMGTICQIGGEMFGGGGKCWGGGCPGGRECWETINPFEFGGTMRILKYA